LTQGTAKIVSLNGRQWVAGLSWASFEDFPDKDELQKDADRLKAQWYALREGEHAIQAGFCEAIERIKHPRKLYSLAAMLADSREQPWLGIFKIEEGLWWYVAVRDHHAILPNGDIIGGEDEIRAAQNRHSGYTDWKYIEGGIEMLSEFIDQVDEKPTPIKSLAGGNGPTKGQIAAGLATVALIAGAGGMWWQHKQAVEERERAEAFARMRAQLTAQKTPLPPPPSPLLTTVPPEVLLRSCGQTVMSLPLSRYGWMLVNIECNQDAVTAHWERGEGATVIQMPEGVLDINGSKVTQTIPLGLNLKGEDDAIALDKEELALRAWAQMANIPLTIEAPEKKPELPGTQPSEQGAMPPPIPQTKVRLSLPFAPFSLSFTDIRGFRINSLESTATGWTIQGVLYGHR
jgi:hypothetical protein